MFVSFFAGGGQAGAAVSERDEMGHVDLEQSVRQVLLRVEVSGGKEGLPSPVQPNHAGDHSKSFAVVDDDM